MESNSGSSEKFDFIFEVSWEVCNQVGGIHTVVASKASLMVEALGDRFIQIGPDLYKGSEGNTEFLEDAELLKDWKNQFNREGLKIRVGRWIIPGRPIVVLIDFSPLFAKKDQIFSNLWSKNRLDSLQGGWDYIEPALFGYSAGIIIDDYKKYALPGNLNILAHFHEWLTGAGVLYLENEVQGIATVFTTHATITGRTLCGSGQPFYGKFETYNGDQIAKDFNITAKHSLEKTAAVTADSFTTVSENTARECQQLLGKAVDKVTINGFDDSFLPGQNEFENKRQEAKSKLLKIASCVTGATLPDNSFLVATSGRYEYKNKGIDLFLSSLAEIAQNNNIAREIIAFILVPASHSRPKRDVVDCLQNGSFRVDGEDFLTHYLQDYDNDSICQKIRSSHLTNNHDNKVKVIFAPIYLDGRDGIFNKSYYDILIGFDLTVFPSYYEPFGYTPLESLSFHVPTVTTTLTGFGREVKTFSKANTEGMLVIERLDYNDETVIDQIGNHIIEFSKKNEQQLSVARNKAFEISRYFLWKQLINNYYEIYGLAIERRWMKEEGEKRIYEMVSNSSYVEPAESNDPIWKSAMVKFKIPEALRPLEILSKNIWWTWHPEVENLFRSIDEKLWGMVQRNPISLLNSLAYQRFLELENDNAFRNKLQEVFQNFQEYLAVNKNEAEPRIAYLSMEYGLHHSIPIYAGGLGILAGDYLKEASEMNLNIIAFGILYRYGYFKQSLTLHGEQVVDYEKLHFTQLPITPVQDSKGNRLVLQFPLRGPMVSVQIWKLDVGRIPLYLFDTDIPENGDENKRITHHLYGGDNENRLRQELLIAAMALQVSEKLHLHPDLFHYNEGHTAFTGLLRIMKLVSNDNLNFEEATQFVKASSLFTTHTPVPAGQDAFEENLLRSYQSHLADSLNVAWERFLGLGKLRPSDPNEKFSMSYLAARLSNEINAVSVIHAKVTQRNFQPIWKGFLQEELQIGNVTNGVHYSTWTAPQWQELFRENFDQGFLEDIINKTYWLKVKEIPTEKVAEIKGELKKALLEGIQIRLKNEVKSLHLPPARIYGIFNSFDENDLIIGFARRFATYKRATLLFNDMDRLSRIVNNTLKPVKFIFAGKAHPADREGQDLIKRIIEISEQPNFAGKILFIQNYDMELARLLVQGVDVWLNTPQRGNEASGTSGMKAAMNGTINFSVMDGWWAEGYRPEAGWALPQDRLYENQKDQDDLDTETLFNILEHEIIPEFFKHNSSGMKEKWTNRMKNAFALITPEYTTGRMLREYKNKYYDKMYAQVSKMKENNFEITRRYTEWTKKINEEWSKISVVSVQVSDTSQSLELGEKFSAEIILNLGKIPASDIGVELVLAKHLEGGEYGIRNVEELNLTSEENSQAVFKGETTASFTGAFHYAVRFFPKNELLKHRRNLPLVKWI